MTMNEYDLGEKIGELTGAVHTVGEKVDGILSSMRTCQTEHGARIFALEHRPVNGNGSRVWKIPGLGSVPVSAVIVTVIVAGILLLFTIRQEGIATTVNSIKELRQPRTTERMETTYTAETKTGKEN